MGKKKKQKRKFPVLIDEADTSTMTVKELEKLALLFHNQLSIEIEETKMFELEYIKIEKYFNIACQLREDVRADLRQKDKDKIATQDMIKLDMQKLMMQRRYMQFVNDNVLSDARCTSFIHLKESAQVFEQMKMELLLDVFELKKMLKETNNITQEMLRTTEMRWSDKIRELQIKQHKERKFFGAMRERRLNEYQNTLIEISNERIAHMQNYKRKQTIQQKEEQEQIIEDMKLYFNDITLNNLNLIAALKKEVETYRKEYEAVERIATEEEQEYTNVREPYEQALVEVAELREKLKNYDRDKQRLLREKAHHDFLARIENDVTWETETLIARHDLLLENVNKFKMRFEEALLEIGYITECKNILLERKIYALKKREEKNNFILNETRIACKPQTGKLLALEEDVAKALEDGNCTITELREKVVKTRKEYDVLLRMYELKLESIGISKDNLGFIPVHNETYPGLLYLCGPAGLAQPEEEENQEHEQNV